MRHKRKFTARRIEEATDAQKTALDSPVASRTAPDFNY
jgi:hypothetical protein